MTEVGEALLRFLLGPPWFVVHTRAETIHGFVDKHPVCSKGIRLGTISFK